MKFWEKGLQCWLPSYLKQMVTPTVTFAAEKPVHIMFSMVDHFEPFHGGVSLQKAETRVEQWTRRYPEIIGNFRDADGFRPQHTWFYPPHHDLCFLKDLVGLCKKGFGEIEMHLHHNHMVPFPDTAATLKEKIMRCIKDYSRYGIFTLADGTKRFAFIHGDWSLDNSRGQEFCGINNEIEILKECGCYADFTFPSLGEAQPAMINKMYYAKDVKDKPKSYNKGKELKTGGEHYGDLLLICGILGLRWGDGKKRFKISIEASNIDGTDCPSPRRIDYWIKNAVRIKGRPHWLFVKLHTHGANESSFNALFGSQAERMYVYLEKNYNDGQKFCLHYVSARQMYNIIKAAEAGKTGNPNEYRDYCIPPYIYLRSTQ